MGCRDPCFRLPAFCKPVGGLFSVRNEGYGFGLGSGVYLYLEHLVVCFGQELQGYVECSVSICVCVCYKCTFFGEWCGNTAEINELELTLWLYCWYL